MPLLDRVDAAIGDRIEDLVRTYHRGHVARASA